MKTEDDFKNNGYVIVRDFVDATTIKTVSRYFENKINRKEWVAKKDPVTKYSYYADPLIELILADSLSEIEKIVGEELYPTYSFSRVYLPGEELKAHIDRPSCEVSVTVNVASVGEPSYIFMKYPGKETNKYILNPGDAVIYQGCVVQHWREVLQDPQLNVQFMLHYVKKNGMYSGYKFDRRAALGLETIN
jgi:alkylated DNA repair dioxygenase AlkB